MLKSKTIDRVCSLALVVMLALTAVIWADKAAAGRRKTIDVGYESLFDQSAVHIKARTTTPGIVPGAWLSFRVIILFANNNIVCHRLPNNPAFTRLFLERIKLFWIE